ncbi:MAG: DUF4421 domain-containing protein [Muribaculaceae bacterium]|nr:DUF4421 domain-containing protein [Muribaculaceae bacterium]
MKKIIKLILLSLTLMAVAPSQARAEFLSLDTIASWGKFPRFCINTYRWGDKFFNSYDSTYVVGTGKRFNIKLRTESWTDFYNFYFDEEPRTRMVMMSNPTTSAGFWLTYMAVSVGYDMNVGKYFGGGESRRKWSFQFNCSLFAADAYFSSNNVGSTITRIGPKGHTRATDIDFSGINNKSWGLDLYYFFNHKNYSQAAAFSFSKIQRKSSGSFYAGLSFWGLSYDFDFNGLPEDVKMQLPLSQYNYYYRTKSNNYAMRLGYGYNWVFHPGWTLAISESPIIGVRRGWLLNLNEDRTSLSFYNRLRASLVYNRNQWFTGFVIRMENALFYDKTHTMLGSMVSFEASLGYRFNLW